MGSNKPKTIFELEKTILESSERKEALRKKLTEEGKNLIQSREYMNLKNKLNYTRRQKASLVLEQAKKGKGQQKALLVLEQAKKEKGQQKDEKLFSLMEKMALLRVDLKLNNISCRRSKKYDALRKAISRCRANLK
jgi:hypothetical protein